MKALALKGVPVNAADIPAGVEAKPHRFGAGFEIDPHDIETYRPPLPPENPVAMRPEAQAIADIYRDLLDGNPIGVSAGMAGLIPERLLWTQIEAYCRATRTRLDKWTLRLLHAIDSIRMRHEFERVNRDLPKK